MNPVTGVRMRDLYGAHHDLVAHRASNGVLVIEALGFGHVVAGMIDVPGTGRTLNASLVQPGPGGQPATLHRASKQVDDGWEVELLPNPSGEDRLVVCVPSALLEDPVADEPGAGHG